MKDLLLRTLVAYCESSGYPVPVSEHKFLENRKFSFDFAWPELKVALEKEGGFYGRGAKCPMCGRRGAGAHTSIQRLLSDKEKYNLANLDGWMILRATPEEFENGFVFSLIDRAMSERMNQALGGR
jgi:hypothetical protein